MLTEFSQYSRFIFFVKILLGLASIFVFFAIFFYSSSYKVQESVTVVSKDVKIGLKYQAYKTRISGFTGDGSAFDFYAKFLDPSKKDGNIVVIGEPKGLIFFPNNEKVNFSAKFATFNIENEKLSFKGKVELKDSKGNFINTDELTADFRKKLLFGTSPVKVVTSYGSINSGGLKYFYGTDVINKHDSIVFDNGINIEVLLDDKK